MRKTTKRGNNTWDTNEIGCSHCRYSDFPPTPPLLFLALDYYNISGNPEVPPCSYRSNSCEPSPTVSSSVALYSAYCSIPHYHIKRNLILLLFHIRRMTELEDFEITERIRRGKCGMNLKLPSSICLMNTR
jgi:hypothetical protein